MIVGALIMIIGLVLPPLLIITGVISDPQSIQFSNAGYVVAVIGAVFFVIGAVLGILGQGAHSDEHARTTPDVSTG
jgi:uncharacterized membrane protein